MPKTSNKAHILRKVENNVSNTIRKFKLLRKQEKILVACSGGKDSTAALYILNKLGYSPHAITVDAAIGNYTKQNLKNIKTFCKQNKIPLKVISFREEFGYSLCYLKSLLKQNKIHLTSCTICGVLRRYLLNKYARKLKADKLVTGHNLDDEAQSVVMNLLKNNLELLARQGPITGISKDKKFVQRVKPLYFITEQEVIQYSKAKKFPVSYIPCPCRVGVYRCMINEQLTKHEKLSPETSKNIIKWFLSVSPKLKTKFKSSKQQNYCKNCNEPAKKGVCMTCQILAKIK
ncbi:adenine nucleotide alpha hydrolase family protein [Candidatus Woesearchaeota archaeon]|nr:adenine nucleotide alpha hydrolase family protein [Candidatus Woesearchaeota archaeon]